LEWASQWRSEARRDRDAEKPACRFESCRAYVEMALRVVHLPLGQRESKTLRSARLFTGG
jgi:hypothetical protein